MNMNMKKLPHKTLSLALIMFAFAGEGLAQCCSRHGGTVGCNVNYGRYVCADGHLSRCVCEPVYYIDEEFEEYDSPYHHHHGHHYHHHHHWY